MRNSLLTILVLLLSANCLDLQAEQEPGGRQTTRPSPGKIAGKDGLGDLLPELALARCGTTRLRHLGFTTFVESSPDGQTFAAADGNKVTLFETATGKPGRQTELIRGAVYPFGFSPDGKWIAASTFERVHSLLLVKLPKGERKIIETGLLSLLTFSADGRYLAAAVSNKGGVILVDLKTQTVKARLPQSTQVEPSAIAISPDGKFLVAGGGVPSPSEENEIQVWDTTAEKVVVRLKGHQKRVMSLVFLPGGKMFASAGFDDTIRFWDLAKQKEVGSISTPALALAVSPDGKILASADRKTDVVRLWKPQSREKLREIITGGKPVYDLAFSSDSKRLLTGGHTSSMRVWDVNTGKDALPLPGHQDAVATVAFSPDGKTLASRSCGNTVRFWDSASGKEQSQFVIGPWVPFSGSWGRYGIAYSPDGTKLAALSGNCQDQSNEFLSVWDVPAGKMLARLPQPRFFPMSVAFAPDGDHIAFSGRDGVRFWSLSSKEVVRHIPNDNPRQSGPESIAFSPDGRLLAMGRPRRPKEDKLEVWDWSTGEPIRTMFGQEGQVSGLAFSPGGHFLASCGSAPDDSVSHLWEIASGTHARPMISHNGAVGCVAISPDGRLLASGGLADHTVCIWNAFTGDELARFKGHLGPVNTVAFSPDGKKLASGSADTTILIWDISHLKVKPPATDTDPENLAKLWNTLHQHDAAKPFDALWSLVGAGDKAVALFDRELHPVSAPDAAKLRQLLADLDSDIPDTREKSNDALTKLGPLAEPALREAHKAAPSAEVRRRVGDLLDRLRAHKTTDDELRQGRAIVALEQIGTPRARELLRRLAQGAAGAPITRDAAVALKRLNGVRAGR